MQPTLYLFPSELSADSSKEDFAQEYFEKLYQCRHFVVENERTARRFLSKMDHPTPIRDLEFRVLDEHTRPEQMMDLGAFICAQNSTGLLSEAGCPGVADPGADLVALAHDQDVRVVALPGASSLILALMSSGLSGQNFCFHGYLDRDAKTRQKQIKRLEQESRRNLQTQIFIETPYRNKAMFEALLRTLSPTTRVTLACELTSQKSWTFTHDVAHWKKMKPDIHKKNVVFLFQAQ